VEKMSSRILLVVKNKAGIAGIENAAESIGVKCVHVRSTRDAARKLQTGGLDAVVLDESLLGQDNLAFLEEAKAEHPNTDFIVISASATIEGAVEAVSRGATNYLPSPVDPAAFRAVLERILKKRQWLSELEAMKQRFHHELGLGDVIACSTEMKEILKKARTVAKTNSTVLIEGETGVGKEVVAIAIHVNSDRPDGKFVAIHCGALPDTLLESELFGHEKGAFTGADSRKIGKFEYASGGTIFLDEISTTSPAMQVKLLRVLQERTITRVGGTESIPVDVRIIAATNADLKEEVKTGRFREDLFYRVNVIPIYVPPLRERKEDIPVLAAHFLRMYRDRIKKRITGISNEVIERLKSYDWPGNVRELENVIEHSVIMEETDTLTLASLPLRILAVSVLQEHDFEAMSMAQARKVVLERFEKEYLSYVLDKYKGRIGESARHAGLTARSIHGKMKSHGIRKESYRKKPEKPET
jgi:DNA-binding NtrC family response regulator